MRKNCGIFLGLPRLGVGAALLTLFFFISVSRAGLYGIAFNDRNINIGSGQIDVEFANNNFYAASGYLNVTAGAATGVWILYTAGGSTTYPGYLLSPAGAYDYNNAVYPNGQNPQYPAANPLLDDYGLLFTQNNNNELNLWGNADGTYTLGGNIGGRQNFNAVISFGGTTINPIPEPINCALAGFGLILVGGSVGRYYFRRHRSAASS